MMFSIVFIWSLCEAVFWPVMPDAVIVPLVALFPGKWLYFALAAMLGTAAGGSISYRIGATKHAGWILNRLPLVRTAMIQQTKIWIVNEGTRGVCHQPISGIPFKVFALLSGQNNLPPFRFLFWATLSRTIRFICVALIASFVGHLCPNFIKQHSMLLLFLWCIAFAIGLRTSVCKWEKQLID